MTNDKEQLEFLPLPKSSSYCNMALSPDGKYLAILTYNKEKYTPYFIIWNVYKYKIERYFKFKTFEGKMYFSPVDNIVGILSGGTITICDLHGNEIRKIVTSLPATQFAWRPNGIHIAIATETQWFVIAHALEGRRPIYRRYREYEEDFDEVYDVAWHPNGRRLVVGHKCGLTIHEMPLLKKVLHTDIPFHKYKCDPSLVYSPDGKYITAIRGNIDLFDNETLEHLQDMTVNSIGAITSFEWDRDSVHAIFSTTENQVILWDFSKQEAETTWELIPKFNEYTFPKQVVLHSNKKVVFVLYRSYGVAVLRL
ncbi:MAG: WD40 repeat domain-containing protein [Candidatus Asgardarchaeia archaeon]